ncbi:MAG: methyltransferase domain-containing protein [Alphaproteobacteria bacterium]|nr:methyltransferase domain-containing protein [Alphaproteobacteria bacterium]
MSYIDFIEQTHRSTPRNYLERVCVHDKVKCATIAKQFGKDYWDGDRTVGYGGYSYDGRWRPVADRIAQHYGLKPGQRVLDVGCGKAFLLYELTQAVPGLEVAGIDISVYGLENAKEEVRPFLKLSDASCLPYDDEAFDLVISLNTLHNLKIFDLFKALREMERVGRSNKYLVVESYRSMQEKVNLLYWQLTCESFYAPDEWQWIFEQARYSGDHGFIYFE